MYSELKEMLKKLDHMMKTKYQTNINPENDKGANIEFGNFCQINWKEREYKA